MLTLILFKNISLSDALPYLQIVEVSHKIYYVLMDMSLL